MVGDALTRQRLELPVDVRSADIAYVLKWKHIYRANRCVLSRCIIKRSFSTFRPLRVARGKNDRGWGAKKNFSVALRSIGYERPHVS